MELPVINDIIKFIERCPFEKYGMNNYSIYKQENPESTILSVNCTEDYKYFYIGNVYLTDSYSKNDLLRILEALQKRNKEYQQYTINNILYDDIVPVINDYSPADDLLISDGPVSYKR